MNLVYLVKMKAKILKKRILTKFIYSQTKEERDAKMPKNYLGNGKVVWTDGTVTLAEREEEKVLVPVDEQSGDLPF